MRCVRSSRTSAPHPHRLTHPNVVAPPTPPQPFLSNSTASWWNKRWDIAAGNTLRAVVFDPICERRWVADRKVAPARPGALMQLLASCASFGTSGLIHEGIYWRVRGWGLGKQVLGCTAALEGGESWQCSKDALHASWAVQQLRPSCRWWPHVSGLDPAAAILPLRLPGT